VTVEDIVLVVGAHTVGQEEQQMVESWIRLDPLGPVSVLYDPFDSRRLGWDGGREAMKGKLLRCQWTLDDQSRWPAGMMNPSGSDTLSS
jgi:hypothetical protein